MVAKNWSLNNLFLVMAFQLWLTSSVLPLDCRINEPFSFDLLFLYYISVTTSMTFSTLTCFFYITSRLLHQWVFRLWLASSISPLSYRMNELLDFDLLLPYYFSVAAFRLWLASSVSPFNYHINELFDFDLLLS